MSQTIIQIYYNIFNLFHFAGVIGCFQDFSTTNKILARQISDYFLTDQFSEVLDAILLQQLEKLHLVL